MSVLLVTLKYFGQKCDLPIDGLIKFSAWVPKQTKVPTVYFDKLFLTGKPVEHGTLYFGIAMNHLIVASDHHLNGHTQIRCRHIGVARYGRLGDDPRSPVFPSTAMSATVFNKPPERLDWR
jgi:hypothetical protein